MSLLYLGNLGMFGAGGVAPAVQTFRQALRAKLLSLPDLTAIVGGHVYPGALPQTHDLDRDGPAVTYLVQKLPRGYARSFGHVLTGSDGTILAQVVLTAEGYTFSQVDSISAVLYDELDSIRNASDWGNGTVEVRSCLFRMDIDEPAPANTGRGTLLYRIASIFDTSYRVALPVHAG